MSLWRFIKRHSKFIVFIALLAVIRGAVADWSPVPTGSMKPSIMEGDVILINRVAYDLKVPFSEKVLLKLSEPQRGDVVVFRSKKADKRMVKRLIGLPGDVVELRGNQLIINGETAEYQESSIDRKSLNIVTGRLQTEILQELNHPVRLMNSSSSGFSSFGPIEIPQQQYLMLGDNRDQSADSRVYGFIPRGEVIGKANRVLLSFDLDHNYMPRLSRFGYTLP